jgi:hypothetical protein
METVVLIVALVAAVAAVGALYYSWRTDRHLARAQLSPQAVVPRPDLPGWDITVRNGGFSDAEQVEVVLVDALNRQVGYSGPGRSVVTRGAQLNLDTRLEREAIYPLRVRIAWRGGEHITAERITGPPVLTQGDAPQVESG